MLAACGKQDRVTFFRDQRASRKGDIIRVNVTIQDKAQLNNNTNRARTGSEGASAPNLFGLEDAIYGAIPGHQDPNNLLKLGTNTTTTGAGSTQRQETISTEVAATVTQVLPNGNLVIEGNQEIRVNNEIREVSVGGVIRPQDIASDNSIKSTQIAQARISYGGRGQLTDVQQPRYGQQIFDIISPF